MKGTELSADDVVLEGGVSPQGGIAAADHQPRAIQLIEQGPEPPAELPELQARLIGLQGTAVGEQKQQRR